MKKVYRESCEELGGSEFDETKRLFDENEKLRAERDALRQQVANKDAGWDDAEVRCAMAEAKLDKANAQLETIKKLDANGCDIACKVMRLEQELDEAEAQAAALRKASESVIRQLCDWRLENGLGMSPQMIFLVNEAKAVLAGAAGRELLERFSAMEEALKSAPHVLCNVAQLLDGWHCDTAWSQYDTEVRKMVSDLQKKLEEVRHD